MFLAPMLVLLGNPFDFNFLSMSQLAENSYFAKLIMRNACFGFPNPSILISKINPKITFFKTPSCIPFLMLLLVSYTLFAAFILLSKEIQWVPKWDPTSTKWRQNSIQNIFMRSPFSGPDFVLHFARPLAHFWHHLGSNCFPFASIWKTHAMISHAYSIDL